MGSASAFRRLLLPIFAGIIATGGPGGVVNSLPAGEPSESAVAAKAPAIVVGFTGGFVRHDNVVHSPVQLAARIRDGYSSGVKVQVYENRRREQAYQEILKLLDADHDGNLSERKSAGRGSLFMG